MTAPATDPAPSKHCPGVLSLGLEAHDLPGTTFHFSTNRQLSDGLAVRCRPCDAAYGKAWREAKARGEKFSAKLPAGAPALGPVQEPATGGPAPATPPEPAGFPVPVPAARGPRALEAYADPIAKAAHRGKAPGYTTEVVGGLIYALPDGSTASTPEGQAVLAKVNDAKAAERRKRDAERKRAERLRKKAGAEGEAATA